MPELPEIENILRVISPEIIGKRILKTEVRNTKLRWPIDQEIISLYNKQIVNVQRKAKYLLLELNIGWIIIHFGMTGSLQILKQPQAPQKHDHIDLIMNNGYIIRYNDPRRFGSWLWSTDLSKQKRLIHLGIEPLSQEFNAQWLYTKTRNSRIPVKPWLMNSSLIAGLGNIYSSEALFLAKISPCRIVNTLSYEDSIQLTKSIKIILLKSINKGGTTICNFVQPDGKKGNFTQELKVYGRTGYTCITCKTKIQSFKQNQRSTFFCPNCQL